MIVVISGTNRKNSVSISIACQYAEMLEPYGEVKVLDLEGLPQDMIFSALYQNAGKNDQFNEYREIMNKADKLVFIIPEYNGSFPGVLKVFIDGLDRSKALTNKKCGLLGISAGDQGAGLALSHFTDILNYCGTHVLGYRLRIPGVSNTMTDNKITNPVYLDKIKKHIQKLLEF
jgi:NAD(P)H-dependent FMN reductase